MKKKKESPLTTKEIEAIYREREKDVVLPEKFTYVLEKFDAPLEFGLTEKIFIVVVICLIIYLVWLLCENHIANSSEQYTAPALASLRPDDEMVILIPMDNVIFDDKMIKRNISIDKINDTNLRLHLKKHREMCKALASPRTPAYLSVKNGKTKCIINGNEVKLDLAKVTIEKG